MTRPLYVIAAEITADWSSPWYGAVPYIEALATLDTVDDFYFYEQADGLVLRFLGNAKTWRGPEARRIKAELRGMVAR